MINVRFLIFSLLFSGGRTLFEGDECTLQNNGERGKCISVHECQSAKKLLESKKMPQNCGFNRETVLVCCPLVQSSDSKLVGVKSDEMCQRYHEQRILLGVEYEEEENLNEFSHMAAIGFFDGNKTLWLCGGSAISEKFILTAAHCTYSKDYGPPKIVRLGELDLNTTNDGANRQDLSIAQIYTHPSYKPLSRYHDIALIKLKTPIDFITYVKPACLHVTKNIPSNYSWQAIGWDKTDFLGNSSGHLLKVTLNLVDHSKCAEKFPKNELRLKNGIIEEFHICAGDSSGKDTCPGDSGGPLQYLHESTWETAAYFVVAGVSSFGRGCGLKDSVGVYTRVSSYIGWIENTVWN